MDPVDSSAAVVATEPRFAGFAAAAANEHSQFGEDGIIAAIFSEIGERNRWCFEVGAHDGVYLSNTKRLRDVGWSAVLIEHHQPHFQELNKLSSDRVHCVHQKIRTGDLDRILASCCAPKDMDFGSIDIDSDDYFVWQAMQEYAPRVVCIEFRNGDNDYMPVGPTESVKHQVGKNHILNLGTLKGYVCVVTTLVNAIFVKNGEL